MLPRVGGYNEPGNSNHSVDHSAGQSPGGAELTLDGLGRVFRLPNSPLWPECGVYYPIAGTTRGTVVEIRAVYLALPANRTS